MQTTDDEKMLEELRSLLAEQVRLAGNGRLEEVSSLMPRVEELLSLASASPSTNRDDEKVKLIVNLYKELCLKLAAEKSELADQLKKMQTGKRSLRAYQDAATQR